MKKIFALILCAAALALTLAACGKDDAYRKPGTGTTLGTTATTPSAGSDNGSYSADPDGEVSQTTDTDGVLEDGMDHLESGLEQGMDDLEQGAEDLGDDIEDMGDDMSSGENGGAEAENNAESGAGRPTGDGATNGNSH